MSKTDTEIIAKLSRRVVELEEICERYEDESYRRNNWISEQKREFGVSDNVSLDFVWERLISCYKAQTEKEITKREVN